ncbi:MAG: 1-deoxy-D-xylulose-5-phosphate synthase, partial [Nitrospirota bacterium]|nr:1-deoxy-D-xylulose-5-phosphate synthase [Nitrospirota bacterium]
EVLNTINSPDDLKRTDRELFPTLASDIREEIIKTVSRTGGHLASSLGVVELTIVLHYLFDTPKDKIIWDVGHQAYAHKLLTGRRAQFGTLRQYDGISGFPRRAESPYDAFTVGHSSTSISAALGMAEARDKRGDTSKVIAVIGDGALTSGLAFEGLNQAGAMKKDLIVVLNDNEMSISPNVGAMSSYLSRMMAGDFYVKFKKETEHVLKSIPGVGESMLRMAKRAEESFKGLIMPGMLFEELGFEYVGPINGHDIDLLIDTFERVKKLSWPVLVHVVTKKGSGYLPAEEEPSRFHGTPPFDIATGKTASSGGMTYTGAFSDALTRLADDMPQVVAITAAMPEGTGLDKFAQKHPSRFYDVGIAESHAITFACGLATEGFHPVVAVYSTFLQRAYDQIVHDLCIQNLPVTLAIDRAGLVGEDGATHHGVFDMAYLRSIPNLVVMAPKDGAELQRMLRTSLEHEGPSALRYPRGRVPDIKLPEVIDKVEIGRAEVLAQGNEGVVIAIGGTVYPVLEAAEKLRAESGISLSVINARFVKPLDRSAIIEHATRAGRVMVVEEGSLAGGMGSAVLELLEEEGLQVPVKRLGIPDAFVEHGTQQALRELCGIDGEGIRRAMQSFFMVGAPSGG